MANYASKDLVLTLTNASAVAKDISQFVRSINGVNVENMTQESHAFGDEWIEHLFTGMSKMEDIVLEGFYSDAADTPDTLYARGATRELVIAYGGTKTTTVAVLMVKYNRTPVLGELTKYSMTLRPSGEPTEA